MTSLPLRVLVVGVAEQKLGLAAAAVSEVLPAALPTPLPGAPDIVEGLIDLRGDVLPVLEVRRRLGLPSRALRLTDCLVVIAADSRRLALRVDEAVTLAEVECADLVPHPSFPGASFVVGTGTYDDDLLVVLDAARFLTVGETRSVESALARRPDRRGA